MATWACGFSFRADCAATKHGEQSASRPAGAATPRTGPSIASVARVCGSVGASSAQPHGILNTDSEGACIPSRILPVVGGFNTKLYRLCYTRLSQLATTVVFAGWVLLGTHPGGLEQLLGIC
jgi:hypothetical protein